MLHHFLQAFSKKIKKMAHVKTAWYLAECFSINLRCQRLTSCRTTTCLNTLVFVMRITWMCATLWFRLCYVFWVTLYFPQTRGLSYSHTTKTNLTTSGSGLQSCSRARFSALIAFKRHCEFKTSSVAAVTFLVDRCFVLFSQRHEKTSCFMLDFSQSSLQLTCLYAVRSTFRTYCTFPMSAQYNSYF